MMPHLLPPAARALNRRRWSFRFSGLTAVTTVAVAAWNATPDDWHPALPTWGKYVVMGVVIGLALLATLSHQIQQQSAQPQPKPPQSNDFHQREDSP